MAELDISPELLEELKTEFWKNYNGNKKINAAVNALRGSEGLNYKEAYNYSFEVGKSLTGAIRETARSDILPDGRMYYNIADKALRPMFENNYRLISDYCVKTQNALNERAGIGIKGVAAPINEDRVNGLLNVAAAAQQFDDIVGEFCRECENYSLSVVDEHIKKNAEIQNSAGLSPKIERFCGHSGCDWCSSLAGTYEYEKVKDTGNDVFRRHRGCTCTVVFIPINGRAENAHTKYYIPDKELIELRKNYVGVDRSGRGGIIGGRGAVYYAGMKDKFSAIKDKIKYKTTPEKYKEVSEEYLGSLLKLAEPESIEQSLAGTNPHGYTTNCQRCVPVYEMRRRGYDVVAADAPENFLNDNIGLGDYKKVFIGAKWTICEGTGKDEITNYLQKCGDGARVEITINTNIGNHIFVAEQFGNTTVFIDPQRGNINVDNYFKKTLTEPIKYCRIDNLKPSNLIKDCIGA